MALREPSPGPVTCGFTSETNTTLTSPPPFTWLVLTISQLEQNLLESGTSSLKVTANSTT